MGNGLGIDSPNFVSLNACPVAWFPGPGSEVSIGANGNSTPAQGAWWLRFQGPVSGQVAKLGDAQGGLLASHFRSRTLSHPGPFKAAGGATGHDFGKFGGFDPIGGIDLAQKAELAAKARKDRENGEDGADGGDMDSNYTDADYTVASRGLWPALPGLIKFLTRRLLKNGNHLPIARMQSHQASRPSRMKGSRPSIAARATRRTTRTGFFLGVRCHMRITSQIAAFERLLDLVASNLFQHAGVDRPACGLGVPSDCRSCRNFPSAGSFSRSSCSRKVTFLHFFLIP